jgi:hypothetical protein
MTDPTAQGFLIAIPVALILLLLNDGLKSMNKRKKIEGILHDKSQPETRRRAELAAFLGNSGSILVSQDAGFVQVKTKKPFSWVIFILLAIISCQFICLLGILYIIWFATQKDKIETFVLDV